MSVGGVSIVLQEHIISSISTDMSQLFELTSGGFDKSNNPRQFETLDYILIYMRKGSGELTLGNHLQQLHSGDFLICRPHETKIFTPSLQEGCEYYWISFNGKFATDILSKFNLTSKENYFIGHDTEITSMLERLLSELKSNEPNSAIISTALFVSALGVMSRLAIHVLPQDQTKGYDKIAPALNSINSDCTSKINVDEYAKMCNLSTSYFTHLFTKVTGFSPMEYKQLQRINIAKNLLTTTTLSVKEISSVIGFKDPLYFGRCFKQSTGQTPSSYRAKK